MKTPVVLLLMIFETTQSQIVETEYGQVEGNTVELEDGTEIFTFYGIPFAEPPVGQLRFKPPEEPEHWEGVRDGHTLPPACPQKLTPGPGRPEGLQIDEDCLFLNIYTPSVSGTGLAVLVYIHGGGYQRGTSVLHPGHFMAARDTIVVTINYRMGAFGFMATGDTVARGNYGLLDQIRALEFVRDNIASFGGNPGKVTIFGESAGATSVGLLGLSPRAEGLFHQMITQSGSDQGEWGILHPDQAPQQYTHQVAAQLNCTTEGAEEMMACLRHVSWERLIETTFDCVPGYVCFGFAPVVDGDVLPDLPWRLRSNGQFLKVPLMSGITSEDGSYNVLFLAPETIVRGLNRTEFLRYINVTTFDRTRVNYPGKETDVFEAFNFFYTPWPYTDDLDANRRALVELFTDYSFSVSGEIQMESQAQFAPVYQYVFGYKSESQIFPEWMGVTHAEELSYLFGLPLLQRHPAVRNDSRIINDSLPWNEEDMEWAEFLTETWTNFAKFGNPTPTPIIPPGSETPITWPERTSEARGYIFMHADDTAILHNYRPKNIAFWLEYLPYLLGVKPPT